jgi:hypothetical protein
MDDFHVTGWGIVHRGKVSEGALIPSCWIFSYPPNGQEYQITEEPIDCQYCTRQES